MYVVFCPRRHKVWNITDLAGHIERGTGHRGQAGSVGERVGTGVNHDLNWSIRFFNSFFCGNCAFILIKYMYYEINNNKSTTINNCGLLLHESTSCRAVEHPMKCPTHVIVCDFMPKTHSQKIIE